jgi:hypothetical protein
VTAPFVPTPDAGLLEELRAMSSDQHEHLRETCKEDLFFLGYGVLGYTDMAVSPHGELANFATACPLVRRLILLPRGTLKSTEMTVADSIRQALADPNETRILIRSEGEENAIGWLTEIKGQFQNNELLQTLFPELIPERFTGPGVTWSQTMASILRKSTYKEPTWTAAGIRTGIVSRHYSCIKYDDIIGQEAENSNAAMQFAIKVIRSTEPLLVSIDENIIDFIGTRKGRNDAYAFLQNFYGEELAIFHRPPLVNGKSIFPKAFSPRFLARLRENDPVTYFKEYANNPIEDGSKDFKSEKLRYFAFDSEGNVVYRDRKTGMLKRWSRNALDIVMAVDPNSGQLSAPDFPAIVILAIAPNDDVFVFEAWARRVSADDFVDRIFELYKQYPDVRSVGIEQAGQQTTHEYFQKKAKDENVFISVQQLRHKNVPNDIRIRRKLQPYINRGRFHVRKDQEALINQIMFHPDVENDDLLTAASYAVSMVQAQEDPEKQEEVEREREDAIAKVMKSRNPHTGY